MTTYRRPIPQEAVFLIAAALEWLKYNDRWERELEGRDEY